MSPYGRSAVGREVWVPGQCVYAELLADTEFQKIGKENWLKER
jgi:hypothetical protein